MTPATDNMPLEAFEEIPSSLSIKLKEVFFLSIILMMGVSGMGLCIDKLYPEKKDKIQDIIIHESDMAYVDSYEAN